MGKSTNSSQFTHKVTTKTTNNKQNEIKNKSFVYCLLAFLPSISSFFRIFVIFVLFFSDLFFYSCLFQCFSYLVILCYDKQQKHSSSKCEKMCSFLPCISMLDKAICVLCINAQQHTHVRAQFILFFIFFFFLSFVLFGIAFRSPVRAHTMCTSKPKSLNVERFTVKRQ